MVFSAHCALAGHDFDRNVAVRTYMQTTSLPKQSGHVSRLLGNRDATVIQISLSKFQKLFI